MLALGREVEEPLMELPSVDSLFFASAATFETADLVVEGAVLVAGVPLIEALGVLVDDTVLAAGLLTVPVLIDEVAGFRAAAAEVVFEGEACRDEIEALALRVGAVVFESTDAVGLWPALEAVGPVALLVGRRVTEATLRVGGLLSAPVVARVVVEEPLAVVEEAVLGRLESTPGARLGAAVPFFFSFSVSVSTPDVKPAFSSPDAAITSAEESTSRVEFSMSDILKIVRNR